MVSPCQRDHEAKNARRVLLDVVDPINNLLEGFFLGTLQSKVLFVEASTPYGMVFRSMASPTFQI